MTRIDRLGVDNNPMEFNNI